MTLANVRARVFGREGGREGGRATWLTHGLDLCLQIVDHFATPGTPRAVFRQRYYAIESYFRAGKPIFVILGGEGAIAPSTGIYYPYIVQLAQVWT